MGLAFPLLLSAGIAVDLSRALIVRERLSQAIDLAALALGGTPGLSDEGKQELAKAYFDANYIGSQLGDASLTVSTSQSNVIISANASVPTTLLAMFGYDQLGVGVTTEVKKETS